MRNVVKKLATTDCAVVRKATLRLSRDLVSLAKQCLLVESSMRGRVDFVGR